MIANGKEENWDLNGKASTDHGQARGDHETIRGLAIRVRQNNPRLQEVYSQVSQNVADRVVYAFKNYFEDRARFPRSKKSKDYRSLTYPQSGFKLADRRLHLSKIGRVRILQHRSLKAHASP